MSVKLCVIPGDGIGPEVIKAALQVLDAVAPSMQVVEAQAGWGTFQEMGAALPESTLAAARGADAVLFGAVGSPSHLVPGYRSPIVALRRELDLYANIRPTTNLGFNLAPSQSRVDLVVVRENTEGLYAGRERLEDDGDTAIAERVITRRGSQRIARTAFELAARRRQTAAESDSEAKVTLVHKANVLRVSDGLFRGVALEAAQNYPGVAVEELLVDTAAMHLARSPERFDVIVTTNMFGDILSDIACIHGGGLGLASSANIGDHQALFEPVHGAAPDIAGLGRANPLAAIGCVAMLFEWLGSPSRMEADAPAIAQTAAHNAQRLRAAIATVLRAGPHTPDLGGAATTQEVTDAVLAAMNA
jgi:homoisocitrate dehydrogenase